MLTSRHVRALASAIALFAGVRAADGQVAAPNSPLATLKRLNCTFPLSVGSTWDETGEPQVHVRREPVISLQFDEIDTQEGSARMTGIALHSHVTASLSWASLHFMDVRGAGSLTVTTVFSQQSHPGKLKAVHTRTDYLGYSAPGVVSQPEVSQYYGECEIVE